MLKQDNEKIDLLLIKIFILLAPFAYGLFYEFTAYFAQIIIITLLAIRIIKNKEIRIYVNVSTISLTLISLGYLITTIYAIDKRRSNIRFSKVYIAIDICSFDNAI